MFPEIEKFKKHLRRQHPHTSTHRHYTSRFAYSSSLPGSTSPPQKLPVLRLAQPHWPGTKPVIEVSWKTGGLEDGDSAYVEQVFKLDHRFIDLKTGQVTEELPTV